MNLQNPRGSDVTQTNNRSRDVVPQSGLCARCVDGCRGNCEVFQASLRGREVIYPSPYGEVTAGADKNYPVDYSHLNIQGYALGTRGLGVVQGTSDTAIFPIVNTETAYGWEKKVRMKVPVFTGALGSTDIARKNWEAFAIGASLAGITLVCGENVCGVDPDLELTDSKKIKKSPEMDRRLDIYNRYHHGFGEILVQMNVEDTRLGVAEYVHEKHNLDTIELKWGQGAKSIGGEIKVDSLERALELQRRGYIVTPDPSLEVNQKAFKSGAIKEFERHSRLGFIDHETFLSEVQRLRDIGFDRITLKTGAYGLRELAMAIKWGTQAHLDLLTIDGAPGGTGMSPWRMMSEWGVPSIYLHSAAVEFANYLIEKGETHICDFAFAGGFSTEDHIYKAIALGSPHTKAVCMGRALMIPGFVGKNFDEWYKNNDLPRSVKKFGKTPEEIFVCYEQVREMVGKDEMKNIPMGAIGIYSFADKLRVGLQQLMAGSRCFRTHAITRNELMSLTEECEKITSIPYVMNAYREAAMEVLDESSSFSII